MQKLFLKTPILRKFRGKVKNFGTHNLLCRKFKLNFCRKLAYFLTHESAARTKDQPKMAGGFLLIIMPRPYISRFLDVEPV